MPFSLPYRLIAALWVCSLFFCVQVLAETEAAPVIVSFSDGTAVSGSLQIVGSRPLTVVPFGQKQQRFFFFRDIINIVHEPEAATMERPWAFKESGKAEKVYFPGEYPLLNFKTSITLTTGQVVEGHIISVAMSLSTAAGKQKLFLQRQIKGTLEQKLEDIVYISSIRMTAGRPDGGGGIRGSVSGLGKVLSVNALDNERKQILTAEVAGDNDFDFGTVLPGSYDVCVFTDTHVLVGHSDAIPGAVAAGDRLMEDDLAAVNRKFPLADDFFNDRWILQLRGNRSFAKALVYKRRADYYQAEKWTPGGFLWHLEVWSWHLAEPDWKLDRRYIYIRHKQKGGEQNRKLMHGAVLRAVKPGTVLRIEAAGSNEMDWKFIRDLD